MIRCNELYLEDVVETSGELFQVAVSKGYDLESFIEFYMRSKTRSFIDRGFAVYCTMLGAELFECLNEKEHLAQYVKRSSHPQDEMAALWIGEFYALAQWKLDKPSIECLMELQPEQIIKSYNTLHDLDLGLAVDRMLKVKH